MALLQPQQQAQETQQTPSGSGFVNLQRILQANKANQLGGTVAGGIQQAGQQAQGAITSAGNQFQTDYEKEQNRQNQAKTDTSRILGNVGNISDQDVNTFNTIKSGASQGPTGLQDVGNLRGQAQQAQQLGEAVGSESGKMGLLQRFVGGNKQYNMGQQSLDSMLLGQTGASQLRQARRGTLGLGAQEQAQENTATNKAQQLQSGAQGLAQQATTGLGTAVSDYDKQMQQRASQDAIARQNQVQQTLGGDLSNVDQSTYNQLIKAGIDPNRELYNTDLNSIIKANVGAANKYGVQEKSDFQKIQDLQKLGGASLGGEAGTTLGGYAGSQGQVGSFGTSGMFTTPSKLALDQAINAQGAAYHKVEDPAEQGIWDASRALGGATPGSYSLTGGYLNQLLNVQGAQKYQQANQPVLDKARNAAQQAGMSFANLTPEQMTQLGLSSDESKQLQAMRYTNGDDSGYNSAVGYNNRGVNPNITGADYAKGSQFLNANYDPTQVQSALQALNPDNPNRQIIEQYQKQLADQEATKAKNQQFYRVGRMLKAPTKPV